MVAECASQAFRPLSRPAQLTVAGRNGRETAESEHLPARELPGPVNLAQSVTGIGQFDAAARAQARSLLGFARKAGGAP